MGGGEGENKTDGDGKWVLALSEATQCKGTCMNVSVAQTGYERGGETSRWWGETRERETILSETKQCKGTCSKSECSSTVIDRLSMHGIAKGQQAMGWGGGMGRG